MKRSRLESHSTFKGGSILLVTEIVERKSAEGVLQLGRTVPAVFFHKKLRKAVMCFEYTCGGPSFDKAQKPLATKGF